MPDHFEADPSPAAISRVSGLFLFVIAEDPSEAESLEQGQRFLVAPKAVVVRAKDKAVWVTEDSPVEALSQGALQADASIVLGAVEYVIELASPAGAGHEIEGCRP